ncbi:MAG: DUF6279 family lipoprotein [Granulosicoccaceae bacterium]
MDSKIAHDMNNTDININGKGNSKAHPAKRFRTRLLLPVIAALTIISGCSNSKIFLSPVYNRLDDQMLNEFNKLGDFNKDQLAAFKQRLGTYHVWHRQSELPQYSALLRKIVVSIETRNTTEGQVGEWVDESETYTKALRECHPVNYSYDLMKTLTDDQLNFIQRRFGRERKINREKYFAQTAEQRVERRYKNIIKWTGRLGFDFTDKQKIILMQTLQKQVSLRKEYYKLSDRWNRKLFLLAKRQESPSYNRDMEAHVQSLWTLLEDGYTIEWESNRQLWRKFGFQFVDSMTGDQRKKASIWMTRLAKTLDSIAKDKPTFEVTKDPTLGCLVE